MVHAHKAFYVCLIGCATSGMAYAQPTEMRNLMVNHVMIFKSDKDFAQIHVGDEKILSVSPTSSRTAIINALATGNTNVIVVDERGDPISEFEVVVSEPSQSRVRIHNKPSGLLGYTVYRCAATFCDYVEETTTKEPAPERPKTSTSTSETTYSDGSRSTTTSTSRSSP